MNNLFGIASVEISPAVIALNIIFSFLLQIAIAAVYKKTHKGLSYSSSFISTTVMVGVLGTVIMMIVRNNLIGAFALLGAFSLIRFRTILKETRDIVFVFFALVVGNVFVVLAAYATNSPYSLIGAERELLQMLAAEPMILLAPVGLFMVTGTFDIEKLNAVQHCPFIYLPGVFIALTYVLTIKLRKSPFDLSTSHHAHQELVKGLTTEFAGPSLAWFEVIHWYEMIFLLALMYLFFANIPWLGVLVVLFVYFLEILIDNINARIKWELMLGSAWIITVILGVGNLLILDLFK